MTTKVTASEIITQKHKRNYLQWGGAYPGNKLTYAGQDGQYLAIDGVTNPEAGGVDPIWVPDPFMVGRYRLVGRSITPPDLAQASLMMREKKRFIPKQLTRINCPLNVYETSGECKNPSDFLRGWSDYVLVYSFGLVTEKDYGTRSAWDSDDAMEDTLSVTLSAIYPVGMLAFCQEASSQISLEVVDITYASSVQCSDCGSEDDGTKLLFAVTKSSGGGSPGLPSELIYSLDGGLTWAETNITGMGATEDALAIASAGHYIIVLGDDAIFYAELNEYTGAPGTFTEVTTGIVGAGTPRDIYVASPREIWMCGDGGYIYKSTDITAGFTAVLTGDVYTDNLGRISGNEDTIVAVGASGQILYSANRGATWTAAPTTPTATTITAIAVGNYNTWWIGTTGGLVYYTKNAGNSWTQLVFTGSGTGTVHDIVYATDEVMYIAKSDATPTASILTTWNGGQDWTTGSPRINGLPVFDKPNRLAVPQNTDPSTAANTLAVAGLAGDGADGIVLVAVAARL